MSNLSEKFTALELLLTTQHQALMAEITALRGTGGPETTLRSINQSIWNLAGPAPGRSIADLYTLLGPESEGTRLYNLIANIDSQLTTSGITGDTQAALIEQILMAIGQLSTYPAGYTVRRLLSMLNGALDVSPVPITDPATALAPLCMTGLHAQISGWSDLGVLPCNSGTYRVYTPMPPPLDYGFVCTTNADGTRFLYRGHASSGVGATKPLFTALNFAGVAPVQMRCNYPLLSGTDWFAPVNLSTCIPVSEVLNVQGCYTLDTQSMFSAPFMENGDHAVEIFLLFNPADVQVHPPDSNFWIGG